MARLERPMALRWRAQGSMLLIFIVLLFCQQRAEAFLQASTSPLFSLSPSRAVRLQASSTVSEDLPDVQPKPVDPNDHRYSASDWWHNIQTLPQSTVLREIRGPVSAVVVWSALVSILYEHLIKTGKTSMLNHLTLSSKPHSLLVSSLALLLVFRTNSAYQRFAVSLTLSMERTYCMFYCYV